jgi:hypothetical protein
MSGEIDRLIEALAEHEHQQKVEQLAETL